MSYLRGSAGVFWKKKIGIGYFHFGEEKNLDRSFPPKSAAEMSVGQCEIQKNLLAGQTLGIIRRIINDFASDVIGFRSIIGFYNLRINHS